MVFNDLFEVEKYVSNLNDEAKQRLISTISFMIINHINQQNGLDNFSIVQKLAALLPPDSQKQILSEVNASIIKSMQKSNIDVFPIIHKLAGSLNEKNLIKVISDISFVSESVTSKPNSNISITATQPGGMGMQTNLNIDKPTILPPNHSNNDEHYSTPYGTNSVLRQTMNGPLRTSDLGLTPPPTPPTKSEQPAGNQAYGGNNLLRQTMNGPLRMGNQNSTPPPPPQGSNQSPPSGPPAPSLLRQTMNGPLRSTNPPFTNTGTTMSNSAGFNKAKQEVSTTMPAKETIRYIIPFHTDIGKRAIADFNTPTEIYQFLKEVNGVNTLDKIYNELYPRLDIVSFVFKTYSVFHGKNIVFRKSKDIPNTRDPRVKIGEWLVVLGYLDNDRLEKSLQLYNVASKNSDATNRRFAVKTMVNNHPVEGKGFLFGNFLVDTEIISKQQLEQGLLVQTQFNEILSSLI